MRANPVLDLGAYDYLVKPFALLRVMARSPAGAATRPVNHAHQSPDLRTGLDLIRHNRIAGINRSDLTPKENSRYVLLCADGPNEVVGTQ